MIREIENIFLDFPDYGCFACDPRNKLGLRLKFFADDEKEDVFTTFNPETHLEGFPGISISAWASRVKTRAWTARACSMKSDSSLAIAGT